MGDIDIKPSKICFNGYEIGTGDFSFEDIEPVKQEPLNLSDSVTITGTLIMSWWDIVKLKFWIWKESFKTHTDSFTLKSNE